MHIRRAFYRAFSYLFFPFYTANCSQFTLARSLLTLVLLYASVLLLLYPLNTFLLSMILADALDSSLVTRLLSIHWLAPIILPCPSAYTHHITAPLPIALPGLLCYTCCRLSPTVYQSGP